MQSAKCKMQERFTFFLIQNWFIAYMLRHGKHIWLFHTMYVPNLQVHNLKSNVNLRSYYCTIPANRRAFVKCKMQSAKCKMQERFTFFLIQNWFVAYMLRHGKHIWLFHTMYVPNLQMHNLKSNVNLRMQIILP